MPTSTFSKRLDILLAKRKLTQRSLAEISGLTESAISHYLKGDRAPNALTLISIANATKVSCNWLLGYGSDEKIEKLV